ncbi:MAG: hypothetical protein V1495_04035 [Pseudomonadota bacterium]
MSKVLQQQGFSMDTFDSATRSLKTTSKAVDMDRLAVVSRLKDHRERYEQERYSYLVRVTEEGNGSRLEISVEINADYANRQDLPDSSGLGSKRTLASTGVLERELFGML